MIVRTSTSSMTFGTATEMPKNGLWETSNNFIKNGAMQEFIGVYEKGVVLPLNFAKWFSILFDRHT